MIVIVLSLLRCPSDSSADYEAINCSHYPTNCSSKSSTNTATFSATFESANGAAKRPSVMPTYG